jgi:hypothetical protein
MGMDQSLPNGNGSGSEGRASDFRVQISARFLKDPTISPKAKLLCAILRAYADAKTGV